MTDVIATYSPNIEHGLHVVEVTLKQWAYATILTAKVRGTRLVGFEIFDAALSLLVDDLEEAAGLGCSALLVLTNPEGARLTCSSEDEDLEDWLKRMVVSIRIVGWEPPTLNQVRAMNGAAPRPDGDRPWEPL